MAGWEMGLLAVCNSTQAPFWAARSKDEKQSQASKLVVGVGAWRMRVRGPGLSRTGR